MKIRKVRFWELLSIARIDAECFGKDAWPLSTFLKDHFWYRNGMFVAEEDGALIGFIIVWARGYVESLAVRPFAAESRGGAGAHGAWVGMDAGAKSRGRVLGGRDG